MVENTQTAVGVNLTSLYYAVVYIWFYTRLKYSLYMKTKFSFFIAKG